MALKRPLRAIIIIAGALALAAALIYGFRAGLSERTREAEREQPIKPPSRVSTEDGRAVITVDQNTQNKSGIETAPLARISDQPQVLAYGVVQGLQELVELDRDRRAARFELDKVQAALSASRKEYERERTLYGDRQNASARAFEQAEAAWKADQAEARSAEDRLAALDASARQRWGATIAGWVRDGAEPLTRLLQSEEVLVLVTLAAGATVPAPPAIIYLQAGAGQEIIAQVVSDAPRVDPRLQGAGLWYTSPARGSGLVPELAVTARLPVGKAVDGVLIPAEAVVWSAGASWVYVKQGEDKFTRREVKTDHPVAGGWFMAAGFAPGELVVVKGAELFLSEEFRARIQMGD